MNTINNKKGRKKLQLIVPYTFMIFYAIISVYPLFFSVISSFKNDQDILFTPFSLPKSISFVNYERAWNMSNMSQYFLNSLILSLVSCTLLIIVCSMAAYAITKFNFKAKNPLYIYFIIGMMIPAQSTIIPLALDIGKLRISDSMALLILIISAFQIPICVLIFRGFMSGIPDSLEEAAIIDGCSVFYSYVRIILPLSMPAIVTVTILNFLAAWNNVLFPLVFLSKEELKPIAIGLLSFFGTKQSDYSGMMSAIVITCLPPLLVYIFAQEKVVKGLTAGAVKG